MSDGVTPACVVCGEPLELAAHMERLDSNQPLIDWHAEHSLEMRHGSLCEPCRNDPERVDSFLGQLTPEQVRRRLEEL
jgi:hypothetical protein